jgi:hypothetical protein
MASIFNMVTDGAPNYDFVRDRGLKLKLPSTERMDQANVEDELGDI